MIDSNDVCKDKVKEAVKQGRIERGDAIEALIEFFLKDSLDGFRWESKQKTYSTVDFSCDDFYLEVKQRKASYDPQFFDKDKLDKIWQVYTEKPTLYMFLNSETKRSSEPTVYVCNLSSLQIKGLPTVTFDGKEQYKIPLSEFRSVVSGAKLAATLVSVAGGN